MHDHHDPHGGRAAHPDRRAQGHGVLQLADHGKIPLLRRVRRPAGLRAGLRPGGGGAALDRLGDLRDDLRLRPPQAGLSAGSGPALLRRSPAVRHGVHLPGLPGGAGPAGG